jgi:hypothetical protein
MNNRFFLLNLRLTLRISYLWIIVNIVSFIVYGHLSVLCERGLLHGGVIQETWLIIFLWLVDKWGFNSQYANLLFGLFIFLFLFFKLLHGFLKSFVQLLIYVNMIIVTCLQTRTFLFLLLHLTFQFRQFLIQIFNWQFKSFYVFLVLLNSVKVNIPEMRHFFILKNRKLLNCLIHKIHRIGPVEIKVHLLVVRHLVFHLLLSKGASFHNFF